MKYLKTYESWNNNVWDAMSVSGYWDNDEHKTITIPESLEERCKMFIDEENKEGIEKGTTSYTINGDTVNVEGQLSLKLGRLDEIPIKFGTVKGAVFIKGDITSLKNSPERVEHSFNIMGCKGLTSLEGGPKYVNRFYHLCGNITSLEGIARPIGDSYNLSFPKYFTDSKLPEVLSMFVNHAGDDTTFEITQEAYDDIELFNDYDPLDGDKLIKDRFNQFLEIRLPSSIKMHDSMYLTPENIEQLKSKGIKVI